MDTLDSGGGGSGAPERRTSQRVGKAQRGNDRFSLSIAGYVVHIALLNSVFDELPECNNKRRALILLTDFIV
jgi:hypothetical protein